MVGPSVFPEKQVIPKWLVLQYFQIHELYQKLLGFSVFPDSQVLEIVGFSIFPDSQVLKLLHFR